MGNKLRFDKKSFTQNVRLTEELKQRLEKASKGFKMSQQDVIRLAIETGLTHFEYIEYDLVKLIIDASVKK